MPRVAIVDDDKAMREAILDLLQVEGFSGRIFDSATAFLADYAPGRFDCLITDIRMPGVDGHRLQQKLRTLGSTMPVIVLTSSVDQETRRRALEGGAIAYFTKPVADEVLLGELRSALRRHAVPRVGGEEPPER